jgi:catechol 2,3-dioxygenase-like lactoylglutathione lyase family enzyme
MTDARGDATMALRTDGLHHLGIRVTDLARSRRFYVDTLGFQPVLEFPGAAVIVNANGTLIGIRGGDAQTRPDDRFDPYRVGLDHLALGVEAAQLEALKAQLDAADVPNNGIEDDAALGARYISFYDPDGIAWELYAMPAG